MNSASKALLFYMFILVVIVAGFGYIYMAQSY